MRDDLTLEKAVNAVVPRAQFLCDNAGARTLGSDYVAYCNSLTNQCATCASVTDLLPDGTCRSAITAFGAYQSGGMKKRLSKEQAAKREEAAQAREEQCPYGSILCPSTDTFGNQTMEW